MAEKRQHKATYARDKRAGGYIIRVEGPHCTKFAGREVPVTLRSGDEQSEKLTELLWSGKDEQNGSPIALYKFEPKPREDLNDSIPF